jgi:hypothetical protein
LFPKKTASAKPGLSDCFTHAWPQYLPPLTTVAQPHALSWYPFQHYVLPLHALPPRTRSRGIPTWIVLIRCAPAQPVEGARVRAASYIIHLPVCKQGARRSPPSLFELNCCRRFSDFLKPADPRDHFYFCLPSPAACWPHPPSHQLVPPSPSMPPPPPKKASSLVCFLCCLLRFCLFLNALGFVSGFVFSPSPKISHLDYYQLAIVGPAIRFACAAVTPSYLR